MVIGVTCWSTPSSGPGDIGSDARRIFSGERGNGLFI